MTEDDKRLIAETAAPSLGSCWKCGRALGMSAYMSVDRRSFHPECYTAAFQPSPSAELAAKIERYEARLEIDHYFVPSGDGDDMVRVEVPPEERERQVDGIAARDATIKLQDDALRKAKAEISSLHRKIGRALGILDCVPAGEGSDAFIVVSIRAALDTADANSRASSILTSSRNAVGDSNG